jgi:hypothetical protein
MGTDKSEAVLIAHVDTAAVTRAQLAALPPVEGTSTFKPIAHIELVQTLTKVLASRDIRIEREQFAINQAGTRLFGTFDLSLNGISGSCASLGLRTANDRTMAIQMIAGLRIFVCDNLAFNGDMVALRRRHTSGLHLFSEVTEAIAKYERHYFTLKSEVASLKGLQLTDDRAKALIFDAIYKHNVLPPRFGKAVAQEYFEPRHAEFEPRTAWSLHNSFTEVIKTIRARKEGDSALHLQIAASQGIGRVFGLLGGN